MLWVRVDNRLIHGQIIEAWIPYIKADTILVANDELAKDDLRQQIMRLAIPDSIRCIFLPVAGMQAFWEDTFPDSDPNILVIFISCSDAARAYEQGFHFTSLNLANLHYGEGKEQICSHVALDKTDKKCLATLIAAGVSMDFRCIPNEQVVVESL